jgi:1-deoxy-D-xylulose-5-phosphate reductoisomerase
VEEVLERLGSPAVPDLAAVLALDAAARQDANDRAARRAA